MVTKIAIAVLSLVILQTATAQAPKTATQYYEEGIKLKDLEKFEEALVQFKKAIGLNANYKEALYQAGWTCSELKKYNESLTYLQKAKNLWPDESKVYLEIGYANDKLGKLELAEENYKKSISLLEDNPLAYKYLAYLYYDLKDYKEALKNFEAYMIYEENVTDEDIFYTKGYCENEMGKYNEAITSLNKAIQLSPEKASTYNELAYANYQLENAEDAIRYYNKAMSINANSIVATNGIADVYRVLKKNIPEAITFYSKSVEIDPKNKKAYYWIGWCYNDQGKYNEAVPYLKKAIQIDEKYVSAITELGYCDYALQNYDDALADFKKSMAIEKTSLNLYYAGLCYVGKKQKAEALKMLQELKNINAENAQKLQDMIDKM